MLKRYRSGITPKPAHICLGIAAGLLFSLLLVMSCSESTTTPKKRGEPSYCERQPLPPPTNTVIEVRSLSELKNAVNQANNSGDVTIVLKDGTYQLDAALFVTGDSITIRSESGNRDDVIIMGEGVTGHLLWCVVVSGRNFTVADVSIGYVYEDAIRIMHDADDCLMHNVRFFDTGSYMVRIRSEAGGQSRTERGIIEWCLFEYSVGVEPNINFGGINGMQADDWTVHHNIFRGITRPGQTTAGFAIMFSYESNNTIVEHNTIYNCDHGIAFGLGQTDDSSGGMIRNNMIHTMDVGIRLESAASVSVYNNSIFVESDQTAAIEYRYVGTQYASIINNLTNGDIWARDGATGVMETNVTDAQRSWFVDAAGGDLRLTDSIVTVVDQGQALTAVEHDFDCEERPKGDEYDIGADEY